MPVNKTKEKPYKNSYLIYSRKSTDDADLQKNSIAYQVSEGLKFAKTNKLSIAPVDIPGFCFAGQIKERHTGFKEDSNFNINNNGTVSYKIERPKFFQLVKYLYDGDYKGVVFLCWDRASRNKGDDGILRKLMKQGVDIRFIQAQYDSNTSAGELHMDIDGMFAQHYSRVISEKVCNQNRKLREEGICTYRAPVGYINSGDSRNKPFDPERAPIVKMIFEKCLEGNWSLIELAEFAQRQGLTMPASRRRRTPEEMLSDEDIVIAKTNHPVTFTRIHNILTNRFYTGMIRDRDIGGWRKSMSHKALITEKQFERVQEILQKKCVSIHYAEKIYYPYRGMVRCGYCKRVYTPYQKKGIDYYGARCAKDCSNTKRCINSTFIESKVGSILHKLYYTEEELADIDRLIKTDLKNLEAKRQKDLEQIDREKRKLREDLAYLRENKLSLLKTTVYSPESLLAEESRLNKELHDLSGMEQASDKAIDEVVKDLIILSELLKDAYLCYFFAKPDEKKRIIQTVFSELYLSENSLEYKCKNGFRLLDRKKFPICGRWGWISELLSSKNELTLSIQELMEVNILLVNAHPLP